MRSYDAWRGHRTALLSLGKVPAVKEMDTLSANGATQMANGSKAQ